MESETTLPFIRYTRRNFLSSGMIAAMGFLFPVIPKTWGAVPLPLERRLRFYNTHTGERLDVRYWRNGGYSDEALKSVNHFFRDFRTGGIKEIDVRLLDLLHNISEKAPDNHSIHLISGYRSPETNRMLRSKGSGVALKSLHMIGQAADIRIPGVQTTSVRNIAVNIGQGGVGYYPKSDFVHVDIGSVRCW